MKAICLTDLMPGAPKRPDITHLLTLGRHISYTGDMANASGHGAITAIRTSTMGFEDTYDMTLADGRQIAGIHACSFAPEAMRKGCLYRFLVQDTMADHAEMANLMAAAMVRAAREKAEAEAKAEAKRQETANLEREYSHLKRGNDLVTGAKNIRTQLKAAFPTTKFSVRSESYSGGDAIRVTWTDGPTAKQVKSITDRYQEGTFDGMTDCYEYSRKPWTDLFGGAKYVTEHRSHSPAMIQRAIDAAAVEYGQQDKPTVEQYQRGEAWRVSPMGNWDQTPYWDWQSIINRTLTDLSA